VAVAPRRPAPTPEAAAYYVVAEAITNVSKHAHARTAAVRIGYAGGALRVAVEDDGRGGACLEPFSISSTAAPRTK